MTDLSAFGTATIHEAIGQRGALPGKIQALHPIMRVCGPAFPVISPGGDNLMLHRAVRAAPRGSVIIADAGFETEAGPWGDLLTQSAQAAGIAGLVISSTVRDSAEIIAAGFPVFCIGRSIKGTTKSVRLPVPTEIKIGGVLINPGDIVVGDADGVVIVPQAGADEAAELCRTREAKEDDFRRRMEAGETLQDIMNLS